MAKRKERSVAQKKELITRMHRIAGQLGGVERMVEEDRYCGDIIIQLSAIEKAVKSLAATVLEDHMRTCLVSDIRSGNVDAVEEIVDFFRKY